jgi:hypothetical protein
MWDTSELYVNGRISVVGPANLIGDYNNNGIVDAADYTLWRDTLGRTGSGLAADGNGNNQIDTGDYTVWKSHFGQTNGGGSGAGMNAAVPEPATLILLLLGALTMRPRRRVGPCHKLVCR